MVDTGNPALSIDTVDHGLLHRLVRADQLSSIRRSVRSAIPINMLLGLSGLLVAVNSGLALAGAVWFALSTAINLGRILLCNWIYPRRQDTASDPDEAEAADHAGVERHLRLAWITALISGTAWAFVPILCDGFTSDTTVFFLAVLCGITAGSVTHAPSYAAVPMAFVTPPLLSTAGFLIHLGGFNHLALAFTVLLYLTALIRITRMSEKAFRASSRLKNEATAMARSLRVAHARAEDVANEMRHRAVHDSLTGLLNREGFMQDAQQLLLAREGVGGRVPYMLLLDLDGFKAINDIFGHQVGDDALAGVGRLLQRELAGLHACAGRLGGDEFAILFIPDRPSGAAPNGTQSPLDPGQQLAAHIIAAVSRTQVRKYGQFGVSIGICNDLGAGVSELLACADAALYVAKRAGRNQYHVFDATLRKQLDRWRDTERDMAHAIAHRGIEIWFQPILCDGGQRLDSFEALLRWNHSAHGWIPPEDMIAVAAGTGQSEALVRLILDGVCRCILALQASGLDGMRVAMNVSPREMSRLPIDDIVLEALRAHGVKTESFEIEITEETALNIETAQSKLETLSSAGVRIAIDDFGVGYSSLATLRSPYMRRLKIDRSFVRDLEASRSNQVLVDTILQLGRSLGVEVVAEGVETVSDLQALRALGCDMMQGYYFARPMPAAEVPVWTSIFRANQPKAPTADARLEA